MTDHLRCPCGACEVAPGPWVPGWMFNDLMIAAPPAFDETMTVGYCPRCGARLGFAEDGTPQVGERAEVVERASVMVRRGLIRVFFDGEELERAMASALAKVIADARQQLDAEVRDGIVT